MGVQTQKFLEFKNISAKPTEKKREIVDNSSLDIRRLSGSQKSVDKKIVKDENSKETDGYEKERIHKKTETKTIKHKFSVEKDIKKSKEKEAADTSPVTSKRQLKQSTDDSAMKRRRDRVR